MSQSQEMAGAPAVPEQFNIEYLLFCHTFNHTEDHISEEDLKMDMVTFPYPVYITELRIIPINHRSPEGMGKQMGQTQPSESELTIYVDNVYNLQAAVFETFGVLKYDTKHFMLKATTLTAATKLLVHGIYTSITLCLYGSPAKPPEQGAEPPPLPKLLPPPPVDSKPPLPTHPATDPLPIPKEPSKKQATKSATPTEKGSVPPPLPHTPSSTPENKPAVSKAKRAKHSRDEKKTPVETHNASGDKLSDYSLVRSDIGEDDSTRDDMLASGDLRETSGHSYNTMEETLDDSNDQTEQDMLIEDSWSMSFNPSHCQFSPLKFSRNIFSSKAEHSINESSRHRSSSHTASSSKSKGANRLRELTRRYRSPPNNEKFVFILEDVVTTMSSGHRTGLSHSDVGDHVIQALVTWTGHSLDLSKIKTMPLAVNVRFLRAGLKLFSLLVSCGETAVKLMLRHNMLNLLMCMLESDLKRSVIYMYIRMLGSIPEISQYA
ncbi:hypothetical protein LOD99_495 [Oopsacas minuta]|uniref:Virilizer N-terminal domain-containing protein n=1 Tax=Oopsacas minuta TaxID=111878 RepID=A0AAV7K9P4_9METZ|nr:hypothetical protein LOD99_495 [Oopsacas minuta]